MSADEYVFEAELWRWESEGGPVSWFFVTMPAEHSADLRLEAGPPQGFGSVRVEVTIGGSTWRTSVFPHKESSCFMLPVKKAIRQAERLDEGESYEVVLRLPD